MGLKAGDKVELRSPGEILETLDENGCLDGTPFMPEMLGFFGREFTVEAQAARACDTITRTGVRRIADTVLLDDLRCSGAAHMGCQAGCRIYWKEAWLRPASGGRNRPTATDADDLARLEALVAGGVHAAESTPEEPVFRCQATELLRASEAVGWWSVRSLVHELTSRNVDFWRWIRVMARIVFEEIGERTGMFDPRPFPQHELTGPSAAPGTPRLRQGQLVRVRGKDEIASTLAQSGRNRGLWFDREMLPYCGRSARVKTTVERFIDERTGRLVELQTDAYILEGVVCRSHLSGGRWFCPRAIYPWWREAWLEPLDDASAPTGAGEPPPSRD
jgi:hypothetical protein